MQMNASKLSGTCQFLVHRGSIGPICWRMSALGSQRLPPFPPFFCFRKISSWPCVWNYTPGSKQGSLTEKKTAVRQWITVLWPDKCLCEEWMRKLGVCQESHTHTPSLVRSCAYVWMQMLVNSTCGEARTKHFKLKNFYYLDRTLAGVVSQHNIIPLRLKINTLCSLHYITVLRRRGGKNPLNTICFLFLFLARALKGRCS